MNTREKWAEMQEEQDSIVKSVVSSYKERSRVGIEKYNKTMDRNDLSTSEWLQHLQEELMDATLYIEKLKQDIMYKRKLIQKLQQLIDKLPPCIRRQEAMDDLIDLKLSESDYHYVSLKNKYKDL